MGLGSLVGAGLGGLLGALSHQSGPSYINPQFQNSFGVNGVGTSTAAGFQSGRSNPYMKALGTAESSLNPLLKQIMNNNTKGGREKFQKAYIDARRPQLDRAIKNRTNTLNSNISGQGLSGASSSVMKQNENARSGTEQTQQLLNQGILGGQQLQQQNLQNLMSKFGMANNMSQQNFNNTLQSAIGLGGLRNQNNQAAINQANAMNQIAQANAASRGNPLSSILSGATGGISLGDSIGSSLADFDFGSLFGGGGDGGGGDGGGLYSWLTQ